MTSTFAIPGFDLAAFVAATLAEDMGEGGIAPPPPSSPPMRC